MPFFEPIEPPKRRRRRRRRRTEDAFDVRWQAPRTTLPQWLPAGFVLATSDEMVVAIRQIGCFPAGVDIEILALSRFEPTQDDVAEGLGYDFFVGRPRRPSEHDFRFGVLFADGRRATTDGQWPPPRDAKTPYVSSAGGDGEPGCWIARMWLTPLPPEGPLWLVCQWPARGIPETRKRLDGGRLRRAAAKATSLLD